MARGRRRLRGGIRRVPAELERAPEEVRAAYAAAGLRDDGVEALVASFRTPEDNWHFRSPRAYNTVGALVEAVALPAVWGIPLGLLAVGGLFRRRGCERAPSGRRSDPPPAPRSAAPTPPARSHPP